MKGGSRGWSVAELDGHFHVNTTARFHTEVPGEVLSVKQIPSCGTMVEMSMKLLPLWLARSTEEEESGARKLSQQCWCWCWCWE